MTDLSAVQVIINHCTILAHFIEHNSRETNVVSQKDEQEDSWTYGVCHSSAPDGLIHHMPIAADPHEPFPSHVANGFPPTRLAF